MRRVCTSVILEKFKGVVLCNVSFFLFFLLVCCFCLFVSFNIFLLKNHLLMCLIKLIISVCTSVIIERFKGVVLCSVSFFFFFQFLVFVCLIPLLSFCFKINVFNQADYEALSLQKGLKRLIVVQYFFKESLINVMNQGD